MSNSTFENNPTEPVTFAIVGAGWRSEFFLRIAAAIPQRFKVSGILIRNPQKRDVFATRWPIPVFDNLDDLLKDDPKFVVVSVSWPSNPIILRELAKRGVAALAETPPAPDVEALTSLYNDTRGAKIQIAEQFHLQPRHAARLAVAASGRLGRVTQAQVSIGHGYHGISLMRRYLNVGAENATIRAFSFASPIVAGPDRNGPPSEEKVISTSQTIAHFSFGDRLGVFDFTGEQYHSWIRSQRLLVRGELGEINNDDIRILKDFQTPMHMELLRHDAGQNGNLEGFFHKGFTLGGEWIYRNPFIGARLSDEELAIATCLLKMPAYADGGPDFYSLAEASQDHYLSLMMAKALESGEAVETASQVWADDLQALVEARN